MLRVIETVCVQNVCLSDDGNPPVMYLCLCVCVSMCVCVCACVYVSVCLSINLCVTVCGALVSSQCIYDHIQNRSSHIRPIFYTFPFIHLSPTPPAFAIIFIKINYQ